MKKESISKRYKYYLDKKLSRGMFSVFKLVALGLTMVIVFIAFLLTVFHLKATFFDSLWDSFATTINGWFPSSEDGSIGYIILNSITAVLGLLFSSVLIGMISSGIERRVEDLRNGNSVVLENDHYVILGYNHGEHRLVNQIIQNGYKGKKCIVILTDLEKPALEDEFSNTLDLPRNVEIIVRHGDITMINDLRMCSIEKARVVIINAIDDNRRLKAVLAVSALKREYPECNVNIISCISNVEYMLPAETLKRNGVLTLPTDSVMASLLAHSAKEAGVSYAFRDLLNYEGSEIYFEQDDRFKDKTIGQLVASVRDAVVLGVRHDGKTVLNPGRDCVVEAGDELILLEESSNSFKYAKGTRKAPTENVLPKLAQGKKDSTVIFGANPMLPRIMQFLAYDNDVTLVTHRDDQYALACKNDHPGTDWKDYDSVVPSMEVLAATVENADHIIILSDRTSDWDEADLKAALLLLKLDEIKHERGLSFNVATELVKENAKNYVITDVGYDYVINSNLSSLAMAQIADRPQLTDVFEELLSMGGNELFFIPTGTLEIQIGDHDVQDLKTLVLSYGCELLGLSKGNRIILNPDSDELINIGSDDRLIVLGQY